MGAYETAKEEAKNEMIIPEEDEGTLKRKNSSVKTGKETLLFADLTNAGKTI